MTENCWSIVYKQITFGFYSEAIVWSIASESEKAWGDQSRLEKDSFLRTGGGKKIRGKYNLI